MQVADLQPSAQKIDKLLQRIESGDIKIPAFQRGFVWNQEQVIELLHTIYWNFPMGSVLLWETHDRLKAAREVAGLAIPARPDTYPVNYVLDGQQRLSSIFGVFTRVREKAPVQEKYEIDPATFEISFDFTAGRFVPTGQVKDPNRSIRLSQIIDTQAFVPALKGLGELDQAAAADLMRRIINYEIPVVTLRGRTKDEVGTIFERINSTGTKLTTLDLMVAWTWSEDFHLQDEIDQLQDALESKDFGDIPEKIILQCLSAILKGSTTTKTILSLSPADVRATFPNLTGGLERAIDFLSTHLRVSSLEFLPHLQQIVGLTYFFALTKSVSSDQQKAISKWFWVTTFSRRYSAQTDEKMDEDIQMFGEIAKGNQPVFSARYATSVDAKLIRRETLSKQSPLSRAFLLLLAQHQPLDLTNGVRVDITQALSKFNRKEYHHIFPRAFLKKRGVKTDDINSLCNYCFLPAVSNRRISSKAPSDYFSTIVPAAHRGDIFETNLLPNAHHIYAGDSYDDFLDARADLVMAAVGRLTS